MVLPEVLGNDADIYPRTGAYIGFRQLVPVREHGGTRRETEAALRRIATWTGLIATAVDVRHIAGDICRVRRLGTWRGPGGAGEQEDLAACTLEAIVGLGLRRFSDWTADYRFGRCIHVHRVACTPDRPRSRFATCTKCGYPIPADGRGSEVWTPRITKR